MCVRHTADSQPNDFSSLVSIALFDEELAEVGPL
jgi:hypothetical protein